MDVQKFNSGQLLAWIILFELGTAVVAPLGIQAKQDAWIAILFGLTAGCLMFYYVYGTLFRYYPDLPLTGYLRKIVGKPIGWMFGFLYLLYFIYLAARDLRDFGELMISSAYDQTPLFVICVLLMLALIYLLQKGLEVFARTAEIYMLILVMLGITGYLFIVISGLIDFKNLQPVLGGGWKPVLTTAFPLTSTFPFGEMVAFTMLLPSFNKAKNAVKFSIYGMLASGIVVCVTVAINVSILGVDIMERSTFPLFTTMSKVNIAEFVQRLDAIILFALVITCFFKIGVFFLVSVIAAADLFKVEKHNKLVLPLGLVIVFCSMLIAIDVSEHLKEGLMIVPIYIHVPFQVVIPLLLLAITLFRHKILYKNRKKPSE